MQVNGRGMRAGSAGPGITLTGMTEAIRALSACGVRRDDLLPEAAQQLNALAAVAGAQVHRPGSRHEEVRQFKRG